MRGLCCTPDCLHLQVPREEWEEYGAGQHLRGRDAQIAERVLNEMVRTSCCKLIFFTTLQGFTTLLLQRGSHEAH